MLVARIRTLLPQSAPLELVRSQDVEREAETREPPNPQKHAAGRHPTWTGAGDPSTEARRFRAGLETAIGPLQAWREPTRDARGAAGDPP